MKGPAPKHDNGEHIQRVRRICMALPGTTEKLSHGEPTFFVAKKVYVMFADNITMTVTLRSGCRLRQELSRR